jgi:hypothetical protein
MTFKFVLLCLQRTLIKVSFLQALLGSAVEFSWVQVVDNVV